jgi:hypothetical protein
MVFMRALSSLRLRARSAITARRRGAVFGLAALGLTAGAFFWAGAARPVSWALASCAPPEVLDAKLIGGFLGGLAVATLGGCLFRWRRSMVAKQVRAATASRIATQDQIVRRFQYDLLGAFEEMITTLQRVAQTNPTARIAIEDALNRAQAFLIEFRDRLQTLQGPGADDPIK